MARPQRFTPEQLMQMQAIQQSMNPTGLGGNQNYAADDDMDGGGAWGAPVDYGTNPFANVQGLMPQQQATGFAQFNQAPAMANINPAGMATSPGMGVETPWTQGIQNPGFGGMGDYAQDMVPRQMNPEANMMAQRFQNAQTGFDGMQSVNAMAPDPVYGADPSVMADAAPQGGRPPMTVAAQNQPPPVDSGMAALNNAWGASQNQGGQRIFDRLGEVNGGVPDPGMAALNNAWGDSQKAQQMQGGRPDMVVAAQNQPNQGMADLNAAWADSQPDPSGGLRNRFAQTMDKTGDLSQPLGKVPSINGGIAQGPEVPGMMNDITRMMAQNDQKRLLGAAQDRAGASQSGLAALGNAWGDSQPSGGKWGQTIESLTGGNIRGSLGGITGKQAGIGAGVGLGALALSYGLKRRKQKKENKSRMAERSKISDAAAQGQYLQGSPGNFGNTGNF